MSTKVITSVPENHTAKIAKCLGGHQLQYCDMYEFEHYRSAANAQ